MLIITVKGEEYDYTTADDEEKKNPIKNHVDGLTIKATTSNTVGNEVSATPNMTNVETATATAVAVTNYTGEANVNLEDEVKKKAMRLLTPRTHSLTRARPQLA